MKNCLFLTLLLIVSPTLLTSCGASKGSHKVNYDAIKANSKSTFQIGIVKIEAATYNHSYPYGSSQEKIKALKNIPIESICNILESNYGINIDRKFDKSINWVSERFEYNSKRIIRNPYYGNSKYERPNLFNAIIGIGDTPKLKESSKNIVNVIYGLKLPPLPNMDLNYWYKIIIKANDEILISHNDSVKKGPVPHKNLMVFDKNTIWEDLITNAKNIDQKLIENAKKTNRL